MLSSIEGEYEMKKNITALILALGLGITGCTNGVQETKVDEPQEHPVTAITTGIQQETLFLPYTITKVSKDLNNDGELEYIEVRLTEGQAIEKSKYRGKYEVCLTDAEGIVIQSTPVDKNKEIVLSEGFDIVFKDYNEDGILDFNIGYIKDDHGYYRFFTLKEGKSLALMGFLNFYWLKSSHASHSYPFNIVNGYLINYYKTHGQYFYESFKWSEEGCYEQGKQLVSDINYDDIDQETIKDYISEIKKIIRPNMTRTEMIQVMDKKYQYFQEFREQWDIYAFVQGIDKAFIPYINRLIAFYDMGDIQEVNRRFLTLEESKSIYTMSLEEFKVTAGDMYHDDYKKHPMFAMEELTWDGDQRYTLMSGIVHLQKFMLVYDEKGHYTSGYSWSDNIGDPPEPVYRKKQKAYAVKPVCYGRGTGIYFMGSKWFQMYKGKLVEILQVPTVGHDMFYGPYYTFTYKLISENYNERTGDYQVTYEVGLDVDTVLIKSTQSITFKWLEEKQGFDVQYDDFRDILDNQLIYPGIVDALYKNNKKTMKAIIKDQSLRELKKTLVEFLLDSPKSNKRQELLELLEEWCKDQEGEEYELLCEKLREE